MQEYVDAVQEEIARPKRELFRAQIALPNLLSGEATWVALERAVNDHAVRAPQDCDVLIQAFDIFVTEVLFIKPHTLRFSGFDADGKATEVVCHFTQVVARIVHLPKLKADRIITGFPSSPP